MTKSLPSLNSIFLPAMSTIFRSKNVSVGGIHLDTTFTGVEIELNQLKQFNAYFDFKSEVPLSFLYTLVQRAQGALMLDKRFTLPIPGMVHIENHLKKENEFHPDRSFEISVSVSVEHRALGSLKPIFEVEITQVGEVVASCQSMYLVKRSSVARKNKRPQPEPIQNPDFHELWNLKAVIGKEYAHISGDKNPIHTSLAFAKMLGFNKRILHGWYSVCRIDQILEKEFDINSSEIKVHFVTPAYLPSAQRLCIEAREDQKLTYQLVNANSSKVVLSGFIG